MGKDFELHGNISDVPEIRDQMLAFIRDSCASGRPDYSLLIAIQEALANAVVHGCRNDPTQTVRCRVECNEHDIEITIHDPGPGFDVNAISDPTLEENVAAEHGRGIFMMRSLMDDVRFEDGGRKLQMTKLRHSA